MIFFILDIISHFENEKVHHWLIRFNLV